MRVVGFAVGITMGLLRLQEYAQQVPGTTRQHQGFHACESLNDTTDLSIGDFAIELPVATASTILMLPPFTFSCVVSIELDVTRGAEHELSR